MTTTTNTFEPVDPARWVEVRTFKLGDDSVPWLRVGITDQAAFEDSLSSAAWYRDHDRQGPISDNVRCVRFSRGHIGTDTVVEVQTLVRYGGVYEQVEALRDFVARVGALNGRIEPEDVTRWLDDILAHDRAERDALARDGHCRHGVYVGGCGVDWMCGACEDGQE